MSQIFTILNDKVVIKKLALDELEGNIVHSGGLNVAGPVEFTGEFTADTIRVKNLITENSGQLTATNSWTVVEELDLIGKGLSWTYGHGAVQFGYRNGNKLGTNSDFDIDANKAYMIDGIAVLKQGELCPQITKSRLKEVGPLKELKVVGNSALADFAYFNSNNSRLGLGTDEPNGILSVVQENLECVITFNKEGVVQIGSYTNTDVEIITDDTARVTFKKNGEVVFGSEATKNANVKINGTLTVETLVADNRIDRYQPLEFKTSKERGIYGQGLVWTGTGSMRQFIMMAGPDRLFSSESVDLAVDQNYCIGGSPVLSAVGLGVSVTQSNLSKVGTLQELNVAGEATFMDRINATRASIDAKIISFDDTESFSISNSKLSASNKLSFTVADDETYYADLDQIAIGNKQNTQRPVKIFGRLSVGINNIDQDLDLAVKGNVSFADKKFVTGMSIPESGNFKKGDICWNTEPMPDNYVGWVCIETGSPGRWLPFGMISR